MLPSPGWTEELREDLAEGLDALPPRARAFPGGPLEIELHAEAAAWGLGDGSHPAFTGSRLHLYAYREDAEDERASAYLHGLSPEQRHRLWRRRAIVHAVIRRWDERLRWSERDGWRQLAGWSDGAPFLVYSWAFSRRAGMESAALDLATFAEELLVPAAPAPLDEDPRCREPSKSRFLDERLAGLDPGWKPARSCPAFEAWARVEHVQRVEVVFAVPSGAVGQAMFGHLLLHFVRDDDGDASAGQVVQLAALVSPFEPARSYVTRGLTGGFRGVYTMTAFGDVEHESLGLEQRALRRFALELGAEQRLRLLERAWELQRNGYLSYRFVTANCATMLRFLLQPALGGAPRRPGTLWETPTQVLEALAPALTPIGLEAPSSAVARRARSERRRLIAAAPREALGASWAAIEAVEAAPLAAYEALARSLPGAHERWRADVLLASMRVERHLLDEATVARLKEERAAILPSWSGPTTDELVAARQRRAQQLAADAQVAAEAELAEWLALDALLRAAPRGPPSAQEQAALDVERAARERFTAVAQAVAALPDATLEEARAEEQRRTDAEVEETLRRSVPESGNGFAAVGFGYSTRSGALLRLRGALLREELGDQRLRGFGPTNAWHLLDATVDLAPRTDAPVARAEVTALSVRLLGRNGWGWGAGLDYAYASSAHEAAGGVEALRMLASDERLTNFLYASVALRGGLRFDPSAAGLLSARAGLAARVQLPGSFASCLRFDAAYRPRLRLTTAGATLEHGALGAVRLTVRLGATGGFAFAARVDAQVEWWMGSGLTATGMLGVELD